MWTNSPVEIIVLQFVRCIEFVAHSNRRKTAHTICFLYQRVVVLHVTKAWGKHKIHSYIPDGNAMCRAKNKHFKVRVRFCRPATWRSDEFNSHEKRNKTLIQNKWKTKTADETRKRARNGMRITKNCHHVKEAKRAITFVYSGVWFLCDSGEMEMIWTESFDIFLFFLSFPFFSFLLLSLQQKQLAESNWNPCLQLFFSALARMFGSSSSTHTAEHLLRIHPLIRAKAWMCLCKWNSCHFDDAVRPCVLAILSEFFGPILCLGYQAFAIWLISSRSTFDFS